MLNFFIRGIRIVSLLGLHLACGQQQPAPQIDVIFWEHQSWEVGGGSQRLTIWEDGSNEVLVKPGDSSIHVRESRLRQGWSHTTLGLVRKDALSRDDALNRFQQAVNVGVHLLEHVKPNYLDGSGTLVGYRSNGQLKQVKVAIFLDNQQGTKNHQRFQTLAGIMGSFDRRPFHEPD